MAELQGAACSPAKACTGKDTKSTSTSNGKACSGGAAKQDKDKSGSGAACSGGAKTPCQKGSAMPECKTTAAGATCNGKGDQGKTPARKNDAPCAGGKIATFASPSKSTTACTGGSNKTSVPCTGAQAKTPACNGGSKITTTTTTTTAACNGGDAKPKPKSKAASSLPKAAPGKVIKRGAARGLCVPASGFICRTTRTRSAPVRYGVDELVQLTPRKKTRTKKAMNVTKTAAKKKGEGKGKGKGKK